MIRDNISVIQERISTLCRRLDRDASGITIIAASKYAQADQLEEVIEAGITNLGENRLQDAAIKFNVLDAKGLDYTKHMIGHLQTNKAKKAVEIFDLIHSVDSLKLAREIEKHALNQEKTVDILVQINTSGEEQKSGTERSHAFDLLKEISQLRNIRLLGLMTMAPFGVKTEIIRRCFKDLRQIRERAAEQLAGCANVDLKYLSMGMTDDFEIAIEEGSNMVRIGRAIFQG